MPRPTPTAPARRPVAEQSDRLTRRTALGAGLLVAFSASGCGVRLEDDAPRLPLVPKRRPIAAEEALLALLDQTGRLAGWAQGLAPGSGVARQLATVHRQQATRLARALRGRGVPDRLVSAAEAGRALPASAAPTTTKALGGLESAALKASAERQVTSADVHIRPMVCALLAQRAAGAALLGAAVPQPSAAWPTPELAVAPLAAVRAAVYGFEVVAAQSGAADDKRARASLAALRALADPIEALAGSAAPAAELGYTMPFAVDSAASARRLARHVLAGLLAALGGTLDDTLSAPDATPLLIRWLGLVEAQRRTWGGGLAPFPGLA